MIDASLTDVWRRRVAAAVIDLTIVLAVLCTLTYLQMERLTRDAAGLLSPVDSDRWNALAAMPNRHLAFGSTTYVLAGAELIMTVLVSALVLLSVYVFIPGYSGTSPGKRLLALKVVTIDGGVVGVSQAALRTGVGVVDFLPGVVPWLLGGQLAQRSPWHQRLGDRAARTAVIDARRLLSVSAAEPRGARSAKAVPSPTVRPQEVEAPVIEPEATRPEPLVGPTAELFTTPDPSPAAATAPAGRRRAAPPPQHRGASDGADPVPVDRAERIAAMPGTRSPEPIGERSPLGGAPDTGGDAEWLGELGTVLARQRSVAAPSGHSAAAPAERRPDTPQRRADDRAVAGLGDPPRSPQPDPAVPGGDPVWNDEWQAWLYFDRGQGSWQRHDTASGTWVPIG